jgi:hypothetical protein
LIFWRLRGCVESCLSGLLPLSVDVCLLLSELPFLNAGGFCFREDLADGGLQVEG